MTSKRLLFVQIVLTMKYAAQGYPTFQNQIPNGKNVTNPCNPQENWPGVGHLDIHGGGDRNGFGLAFAANGYEWTEDLCRNDSDGDGLTNGYELGDPDCVWTPGSQPSRTTNITHPGVCEPTRKRECRETVVESSSYPTQEKWLSDVCPKAPFFCPGVTIDRGADVQDIEFRLPTLQVPAKHTTYMCTIVDFPDVTKDYHIFAFTPIIVNAEVVHHIIAYAIPEDYTETGVHECGMIDNFHILAGWTLGFPGVCYHSNIGFRVGKTGFKRVLLQTCTKNLLIGNLQVFAAAPHMHLLGREMKVSQYRNGKLVRVIFNDLYYDFNNPSFFGFPEPIIVKPGDELHTECRFSSLDRNTTTYFGQATTDEMCSAVLVFVPAQNIPSVPTCIAWQRLLPCDNCTYGECNINALDRFSPKVFPTSKLYRSITSSCRPSRFCTKKCRRKIRRAKSRDPCLRLSEPWQYIRQTMLFKFQAGKKFLQAYDSC